MATTIEPEVRRESAAKAAPPAPASAEPKPGGRRGTAFMIMGVVLLALVALGARRWIYGLSHVSSDNAQVDGHIVPILPKVGGFVTEVRIDENQNVKAGEDRKSTRLNSSHTVISYAVFCLKKNNRSTTWDPPEGSCGSNC